MDFKEHQRQVFGQLVGENIDRTTWGVIYIVCEYYPVINQEQTGITLNEAAELYKKFGTKIFYDLCERAEQIEIAIKDIENYEEEIEIIKGKLEEVKENLDHYEKNNLLF